MHFKMLAWDAKIIMRTRHKHTCTQQLWGADRATLKVKVQHTKTTQPLLFHHYTSNLYINIYKEPLKNVKNILLKFRTINYFFYPSSSILTSIN